MIATMLSLLDVLRKLLVLNKMLIESISIS